MINNLGGRIELRISSVCVGDLALPLSSTGGSFFGPPASGFNGEVAPSDACLPPVNFDAFFPASVRETRTGLSYRTSDCDGVIF